MPSGKGSRQTKARRIPVRCWFCEGGSENGCPNPATCHYVHPTDRDWEDARSANKFIRCNYYYDNGQPKDAGCPSAHCSFLHPNDVGWPQAAGRGVAGRPPPIAPTAPRGAMAGVPTGPVHHQPQMTEEMRQQILKMPPPSLVRLKPKPGAGRCRFYSHEGEPINGGCPWAHECLFLHPNDPEWQAPGGNYKTIRCAFIDSDGKALHGGCRNPSNCSYLHPEDLGWESAPRLYKTSRCINFYDSGKPVGRGCPHVQCTYIHPGDTEWEKASPRNEKAFKQTESQSSTEDARSAPDDDRAGGMDVDNPRPRRWGGKEMPSYEFKDAQNKRLENRYPRRSLTPPPRRYSGTGRGRPRSRTPPGRGDGRFARGAERTGRGGGGGKPRDWSPERDRDGGRSRRGRQNGYRSRSPPPARYRSRSRSPTGRGGYRPRHSLPNPRRDEYPRDRDRDRDRERSRVVSPVMTTTTTHPSYRNKVARKLPSLTLRALEDDEHHVRIMQILIRVDDQLNAALYSSRVQGDVDAAVSSALQSLTQVSYAITEDDIFSPVHESSVVAGSSTARLSDLQKLLNFLCGTLNATQAALADASRRVATSGFVLDDRLAQILNRLQRVSISLNVLIESADVSTKIGNAGGNMGAEQLAARNETMQSQNANADANVNVANGGDEQASSGVLGKFWSNFRDVMSFFGAAKPT